LFQFNIKQKFQVRLFFFVHCRGILAALFCRNYSDGFEE